MTSRHRQNFQRSRPSQVSDKKPLQPPQPRAGEFTGNAVLCWMYWNHQCVYWSQWTCAVVFSPHFMIAVHEHASNLLPYLTTSLLVGLHVCLRICLLVCKGFRCFRLALLTDHVPTLMQMFEQILNLTYSNIFGGLCTLVHNAVFC